MQTNAKRQRRYRERALKDPDGLLLTRLQVSCHPTNAAAGLERIFKATGKAKREVIEQAIIELERRVTL